MREKVQKTDYILKQEKTVMLVLANCFGGFVFLRWTCVVTRYDNQLTVRSLTLLKGVFIE
jgi:hypothetical protein